MGLTTCTHIHVFVQSWFSLFRHLTIWYNRDKPFYLTLNSSSTLYVVWLQVQDTPGKNTYVKVEHDFFIVTRSNEHKNKLFVGDTWQWLTSLDKLGAGGQETRNQNCHHWWSSFSYLMFTEARAQCPPTPTPTPSILLDLLLELTMPGSVHLSKLSDVFCYGLPEQWQVKSGWRSLYRFVGPVHLDNTKLQINIITYTWVRCLNQTLAGMSKYFIK